MSTKPSKPVMLQLLEQSAEAAAKREVADVYYGLCSICHGRLFEGEILRCTPCNKRDVANDEIPF